MSGHAASAPDVPGWRHTYSGKVRDLYEPVDGPDDRMLVVASDRVSAYDHVLEPGIPGKGALLTTLSTWWFARLDVPNHLLDAPVPAEVAGRGSVVKKLRMYPIEAVVRGYLTGSGWAEYRESGTVCGIRLPDGLADGDQLPEPIYTPAFKAEYGEHDENITFERTVELIGEERATELRDLSLAIFARASVIAEEHGVLLADTKFEFGADPVTGETTLGDEVLTSDSSRFWDATGPRGLSFDKQIVRDWLRTNWDGTGVPPTLPLEIVERTALRYAELIERLTA